jgi:hypothetical protein
MRVRLTDTIQGQSSVLKSIQTIQTIQTREHKEKTRQHSKAEKKPELFDQGKKPLPQGIERSEKIQHTKLKPTERINSKQQYISFLETSFAPFQQSTDSWSNTCQLRKILEFGFLLYPLVNPPVRIRRTVLLCMHSIKN